MKEISGSRCNCSSAFQSSSFFFFIVCNACKVVLHGWIFSCILICTERNWRILHFCAVQISILRPTNVTFNNDLLLYLTKCLYFVHFCVDMTVFLSFCFLNDNCLESKTSGKLKIVHNPHWLSPTTLEQPRPTHDRHTPTTKYNVKWTERRPSASRAQKLQMEYGQKDWLCLSGVLNYVMYPEVSIQCFPSLKGALAKGRFIKPTSGLNPAIPGINELIPADLRLMNPSSFPKCITWLPH